MVHVAAAVIEAHTTFSTPGDIMHVHSLPHGSRLFVIALVVWAVGWGMSPTAVAQKDLARATVVSLDDEPYLCSPADPASAATVAQANNDGLVLCWESCQSQCVCRFLDCLEHAPKGKPEGCFDAQQFCIEGCKSPWGPHKEENQ